MTRRAFLAAALTLALGSGCTSLVVSVVAGSAGDNLAYASDDDPRLVAEALPFALKTIESLLQDAPENRALLLAAAAGFTQYAYGFVQQRAEELAASDPTASAHELMRAKKLFRRARGYGLRALDAEYDNFTTRLVSEREVLLADVDKDDVALLYWTAAAWAAEIVLAKQDMALVGELPLMDALMARALDLDEAFDHGAIHEFYIAYDGGRSPAAGGSVERARTHFTRAVDLADDQKIGPYVTWAATVSVQAQDRREFAAYLEHALTFDVDRAPRYRLVNLIAQERARRLRAQADDLFLEE
ncbi:MAG: TRAP transporter TatT component family protein [Myxococcota bacterium]